MRLSPISISRTSSKRAAAKKYIYCSSYSSKTTELNSSPRNTPEDSACPNCKSADCASVADAPEMRSACEMLSVSDVEDILSIPLLGVIPESQAVLKASNQGIPVIMDDKSDAGQAYSDAVERLLGKEVPHRFLEAQKKGLLKRLFGG